MKKSLLLLLSILILISCNKEDEDIVSKSSLIGKWRSEFITPNKKVTDWSKIPTYVFLTFNEGGNAEFQNNKVLYCKNLECEKNYIYKGIWTRNKNIIKISETNIYENYHTIKIIELTKTVLKISVLSFKGENEITITYVKDNNKEVNENKDNLVKNETPNYVPKDGLISWWSFSGNTKDSSKNKNDIKSYGAILTKDRFNKDNSAYFFNGKDNYIEGIISKIPLGKAKRTVSGWFKAEQQKNKSDICIFNYGKLKDKERFSIGLYGKGYLQTMNGTEFTNENDFYVNNYNFLDNDWYHFVVTYNEKITKIYINGEFVKGNGWSDFKGKKVNLNTSSNKFRVGARLDGDETDESFKGSIDDIGIWNRVLTDDEIKILFKGKK